ncbi:MAG TPA: HAMP domain-containing histidine kinase, partial [candidate division Zixibacteria bacterium]|nr:HAMP domain-containing histidine kinase [candidate division Zixibacteria bacterium]
RNPLNAIGIAAQMLSSDFSPKEDDEGYREILRNVRVEITRLDKVVREFIGLSAPMAPDLKRRPLAPILEEIAEAGKLRANGKHIEFNIALKDVGTAAIDEEQLKKALLNLIKNAVEATPEYGEICFSANREGERILIEVWDDGPPIPSEIREKLGKPFVSSGKEGGTGIGLFLAFRVARDHGGKIEVKSDEAGTSFKLILPAC